MTRRLLVRTEPAAVTRLTTLEQLKIELKVTGTAQDVELGKIIDYCSNEISKYLNNVADEVGDSTVGRETMSETIYGADGVVDLLLSRCPVGDLVKVTEGGATVERLTGNEPNPAFPYVVSNAAGIMWKIGGDGPTAYRGNVLVVEYTAGWILPGVDGRTLPATIEDACLRFCRSKVDQVADGEDLAGPLTGATIQGVGEFQFGGQTSSRGRGLPYEVRNLIERYQMPIAI